MSRFFVAASLCAAAIVFAVALAWRPPPGDLLDRVAAPALSDRRAFEIAQASVSDDGVIALRGRLPGVRIASMRWYVSGEPVAPARLTLDGDRFDTELHVAKNRDDYHVFAYAFDGGHPIAMREQVVVAVRAPVATVPPARLAAQHRDPSIDARGNVDQLLSGDAAAGPADQSPIKLHSSARLKIDGWAVDTRRHVAAPQVEAVVDGATAVDAEPTVQRPDIVRALNGPAYARCGFTLLLPSGVLTSGRHAVELRVLEGERYGSWTVLTLDVSV